MANPKIQLTIEGLEELKSELKALKEVKLPKVIARVSSAREQGDLSENADYHSAKEEQNFVETRISEIEDVISRSVVVKESKGTSKVSIGSKVSLTLKGKSGKTFNYEIVGEFESDPEEGKISSVSPIGKALLGKKKGESVPVVVPAGEVVYHIEDIQ
jgi:transcription elongation factor GreA